MPYSKLQSSVSWHCLFFRQAIITSIVTATPTKPYIPATLPALPAQTARRKGKTWHDDKLTRWQADRTLKSLTSPSWCANYPQSVGLKLHQKRRSDLSLSNVHVPRNFSSSLVALNEDTPNKSPNTPHHPPVLPSAHYNHHWLLYNLVETSWTQLKVAPTRSSCSFPQSPPQKKWKIF